MSELTFSTIPDVCLLLIFDKIPLNDLVCHVNLVNRHWNTISRAACQNRTRLVLSFSYPIRPFDLIIESFLTDPFEVGKFMGRYFGGEHESLVVSNTDERLNRQSIDRLIERLPNISTLEVNLEKLDISTSEHLATLITGWREHLVTLKLFTFYSGNHNNQSLLDLLAKLTNLHSAINSLPVLRHLTYQLDFIAPPLRLNDDQIESFPFPISCPSLRELYLGFYTERTVRQFSKSFCDHVQSEEASGLTKIACHIPFCNELDQYLAISDVVASKVTHVALAFDNYHPAMTETKLMNLSRKFYNLTHITHEYVANLTVDKLSKCLSILKKLNHITIDFNEVKFTDEDPDNSFPKPKVNRIIPLTQIKSVNLNFLGVLDHQTFTKYLCFKLVVPNVQVLSIENDQYNCIRCGGQSCAQLRNTTKTAEWNKCFRAFLAPIAKCDKLKRIDYWDYVHHYRTGFSCSLDRFKDAEFSGLNSVDWVDFVD